jgi:hypothetical protein
MHIVVAQADQFHLEMKPYIAQPASVDFDSSAWLLAILDHTGNFSNVVHLVMACDSPRSECSLRTEDSDDDCNDWWLEDPAFNEVQTKPSATLSSYDGSYPSLAGLLDSENEIRLLALEPSTNEFAPIVCRLYSRPRDSGESYEALSYTWGKASKGLAITVNQHAFPVTDNLYAALRRLRRWDCTRKLWVDALCINQGDLHERAAQVKRMGKVYENASRVIIWLGDCDEPDVDTACELNNPRFQADHPELWRAWRNQGHQIRSLFAAIQRAEPKWWDRAWVVQEVVVSRIEPLVTFGQFTMPYSSFKELLAMLIKEYASLPATPRSQPFRTAPELLVPPLRYDRNASLKELSDRLEKIQQLKLIRETTVVRLYDALIRTHGLEAKDFRDRVFSLLSVICRKEAALISVDYSISQDELFARATEASIMARKDYFCLLLAKHPRTILSRRPSEDISPQVREHPSSWAVDFNHPFIDACLSIDHRPDFVTYVHGRRAHDLPRRRWAGPRSAGSPPGLAVSMFHRNEISYHRSHLLSGYMHG